MDDSLKGLLLSNNIEDNALGLKILINRGNAREELEKLIRSVGPVSMLSFHMKCMYFRFSSSEGFFELKTPEEVATYRKLYYYE